MSDRKTLELKLEQISQLAQSVASPLGLGILDIRFGQQGKRRTLEVTIIRPGAAVSLTDCEQLSKVLDSELDRNASSPEPLIEGPFLLEVQSPGIDRQLKTEREFKLFAGQAVQIQTKEKVGDLGCSFIGTLAGSEAGRIHIKDAEILKQGQGQSKTKTKCQATLKQDVTLDLKSLIYVKLYVNSFSPKPARRAETTTTE